MHDGRSAGAATQAKALGVALVATLAVAACGAGPTGQSSPGQGLPTPQASIPTPSLPGQTNTAWGRIWDGVPPSFPTVPGAVIATDPGDGATSATLALESPDPQGIASFYRDALVARGFGALVDGPLEDGRMVVDADDGYGCRVRVTVRPAGSTNLISVLYASGCPY